MFWNWFFRVWSLLPLFSLTLDENYGYNKKPKKSNLRFSIINLRLGKYTYYFLTFTRKENKNKFKLKEKLCLDNCQWASEYPNIPLNEKNSHIESLSKQYVDEHLCSLENGEIETEKEFLEYLQANLSFRKSLSYDKMNYYTAIILVFIPIGPAFFKNTLLPNVQSCWPLFVIYTITAVTLFYFLVNWCLLAIQYVSVTGINKSSFRDIKHPPFSRDKQTQQLYSYYHDWLQERFDTNLRVAYVVETEMLVKCSALLLLLMISLPITATFLSVPITEAQQDGMKIVYSFNIEELKDPFSADSLELAELHAEIIRTKPRNLVVIIGTDSDARDVVNKSLQQYQEYIEIRTYTDSELSPFDFKIALLGA